MVSLFNIFGKFLFFNLINMSFLVNIVADLVCLVWNIGEVLPCYLDWCGSSPTNMFCSLAGNKIKQRAFSLTGIPQPLGSPC